MENQLTKNEQTDQKGPTILVAVDLSHYSKIVLRKIKSLLTIEPSHLVALHMVDHHFVMRCKNQAS